MLLAVWVVVVEHRMFRVRRVVLDGGAVGLPPLRILHLSDMHFHGRDGPILAFLQKLAGEEDFDLVLLTGDLIDNPAGIESAARAASLFHPTLGAFAVLGGHDYAHVDAVKAYIHLLRKGGQGAFGQPNPAGQLVARLEAQGVHVLKDRGVRLSGPEGSPFAVVGLRDAFVFNPDFEAAWDGLDEGTPVIAIAHSPDVLPEVLARGAALAFFGHTHGGQVRFPLLGALVTRCSLPGRLASGTFRQGRTVFILNNGLGTSPALPYRLLCRPEVTVAEVTYGAGAEALTPVEDARLG